MAKSLNADYRFGYELFRRFLQIVGSKQGIEGSSTKIARLESYLNIAVNWYFGIDPSVEVIPEKISNLMPSLEDDEFSELKIALEDYIRMTYHNISLPQSDKLAKRDMLEYIIKFDVSPIGFYSLLRDVLACGYEEQLCDTLGKFHDSGGLISAINAAYFKVPVDDIIA